VFRFIFWLFYPLGKRPGYRKLGGPQNRSADKCIEENVPLLLQSIEAKSAYPVADELIGWCNNDVIQRDFKQIGPAA
jgi:hypothetical protein